MRSSALKSKLLRQAALWSGARVVSSKAVWVCSRGSKTPNYTSLYQSSESTISKHGGTVVYFTRARCNALELKVVLRRSFELLHCSASPAPAAFFTDTQRGGIVWAGERVKRERLHHSQENNRNNFLFHHFQSILFPMKINFTAKVFFLEVMKWKSSSDWIMLKMKVDDVDDHEENCKSKCCLWASACWVVSYGHW